MLFFIILLCVNVSQTIYCLVLPSFVTHINEPFHLYTSMICFSQQICFLEKYSIVLFQFSCTSFVFIFVLHFIKIAVFYKNFSFSYYWTLGCFQFLAFMNNASGNSFAYLLINMLLGHRVCVFLSRLSVFQQVMPNYFPEQYMKVPFTTCSPKLR